MENTDPRTPDPSVDTADAELDPNQAVWDQAREAFLGGATAAEVADQLGVSERSLQRRAAREGWRRKDRPLRSLPNLPPPDLDDPDDPLNQFMAVTHRERTEMLIDPSLEAYVRFAFRRSAEAAALGRMNEALGWARLFTTLQRGSRLSPVPDEVTTTPDLLRAAYGHALRAQWGENEWPEAMP